MKRKKAKGESMAINGSIDEFQSNVCIKNIRKNNKEKM